jgi:universal stress protein A
MLILKKIICPTDFSKGSEHGISVATDLALQSGAEVVLATVLSFQPAIVTDPNFAYVLPEYEGLRAEADAELKEIASSLAAKSVRSRTLTAYGDPANEIVRIADQESADLIVIATFGKTGWRRLAFGSVTEKVVRLANCPVLTVRGAAPQMVPEEQQTA